MIKIEKRVVEVNEEEFLNELKSHIELIKKHMPNQFGISFKAINSLFNCKLSLIDYIKLSEKFGFRVYRGKAWIFTDILKK